MLVSGFTTYKKILKSQESVFSAWSQLDESLQRRAEIIPNLVNTLTNHVHLDTETIEYVTEARIKANAVHLDLSQLSDTQQVQKFALAQQDVQTSLAKLLAVGQENADLKTNQNFINLQYQLDGIEGRINAISEQVNAVTQRFNYSIHKFPGVVVNKLFLHLDKIESFTADVA